MLNFSLEAKIRILRYNGKSKEDFFKNITNGDIILLSMPVNQNVQGASNGKYATEISLHNIRTEEVFTSSLSNIQRYLFKMEYNIY